MSQRKPKSHSPRQYNEVFAVVSDEGLFHYAVPVPKTAYRPPIHRSFDDCPVRTAAVEEILARRRNNHAERP